LFGWFGYSGGVFVLDIEPHVRTAKNEETDVEANP
jgi:hypothetical protein